MFKAAIFGDSGEALNDGTTFYYSPGQNESRVGSGGPLQEAVAKMMDSWNVSDLINTGDASYTANSSTLLDYNIGKFYNHYMQPYGNQPAEFAYADPNSIYSVKSKGGVQAETGKLQWPFNLYNFPNGFPNPTTGGQGGSSDGLNHFWLTPGNHDTGTIIANYTDTNVNNIDRSRSYIGTPVGPDAWDYQNNISKQPTPPPSPVTSKTGSLQQLLDYFPYLESGNSKSQPSYLRPGQLSIGKADPSGYGIYYSVNLGNDSGAEQANPLVHAIFIDTNRLLIDAGYYAFNFASPPSNGNFKFDPTNSKASEAYFQPPGTAPTAPSLSTQMFEWVKNDLKNSKAKWNIVVGHAPSYHVGNSTAAGNKTYFNNPLVIKFLAGLKDQNTGKSLIDAYVNGHSHAYARVLEMAESKKGIGLGIPLITVGNSGTSVLNTINLAPYGSNVLEPPNYNNTFTVTPAGKKPLTKSNKELFFPDKSYDAYIQQLPADAKPTSVGLSALYAYSTYNKANGGTYSSETFNPSKVVIKSVQTKTPFALTNTLYNTLLKGPQNATSDVSGLYGFGSGASYVEADRDYFFTNYKTAHPLDPAVTLIGRQQGLNDDQMTRGSQFYSRWSPKSAALQDLALFSFKVYFNANKTDAFLGDLELVQPGNGYMETEKGSGKYINGTHTFEINGNNPIKPLGFGQSDPTRAAVNLTFNQGRLVNVAFAKDAQGKSRVGSGYQELANAANGNNNKEDPKRPLLVGIDINLERQMFLADQAPGNDLYQDWYLMTDTTINSSATSQGSFGGLKLNIGPSAARAREILATQRLTTGYSGTGQQTKFSYPQQGKLTVTDALGHTVAGATSAATRLSNGATDLELNSLPAPGALKVAFDGDPTSSYQVNFKASAADVRLSYGAWTSSLRGGANQTLALSNATPLTVNRCDTKPGRISFGLRKQEAATTTWILNQGSPASDAALDTSRIFTASGTNSWLATKGQALGSTAATLGDLPAGTWIPTASDSQGHQLAVKTIEVSNNTATVNFSGGIQARYSAQSSGILSTKLLNNSIAVNIKSLAPNINGLAFYPTTDPVTGTIRLGRKSLRTNQQGYAQAALELAKRSNLLLSPSRLPNSGEEATLTDLPLDSKRNYGMLLLRNNKPSDLSCSFSRANPDNVVTMQSFSAPERGVIYGINAGNNQNTFNDLIVTMSAATPQIL